MALKIFDKYGILKLVVEPADSSTHQHGIQEDNVLNLSFTTTESVLLDVNDHVVFESDSLRMIEQYAPQQKSTVEWSYNCKFYGTESLIRWGLVLKLVDNEMQPVFSLTAPAREHLKLLVDNINRIFNTSDFKVGEVIATENLVIEYNSTSISDGLSKLSEGAGTEWWFDGLTVNLIRCERGQKITLGYRNGLTRLERTTANNVQFFTRLFPLGSTRNIDVLKYGYNRLQLPDGQKYVEQNVETYGIIEQSEEAAFSHIYPKRVGVISAVRSEEKTGQDGNLFKIYHFKDKDLPFNPNDYEIGGLVKRITFESGELNGREFEVNYDSDKKEFEIITQFPDHSDQLPNDVLTPEVNNKYVLWNIRMPDEYYTLAQQEFKTAVDAYMTENNLDKSVYKAQTDYIEIARQGIELSVGQRIRLESNEYFPGTGYRNSRITRITRKVNEPTQMDIEISDVLSKGKITELTNTVQQIKTVIENTRAGLPEIIKSWEGTPPADTNLFSALRSMYEFLNKNRDGEVVQGYIRFLKQLFIGKNVIDSLIGGAGTIIDDGRIQTRRLEVEGSLTVLELIFNRLSAQEGNFSYSESGTIEKIEKIDATTYRLFLRKRWENDFTAFALHDVAYGTVNNLASGTGEYYTSWFRVLNVNTVANHVTVSLYPDAEVPGNKNYPPVPQMVITRRGNAVDEERQGYWYISSYERCICMLDGVTKPVLEENNYSVIIGRLKHLSIFDNLPINYLHSYVFCRGITVQDINRIRFGGKPVQQEINRGTWSLEVTQGNDPYRNISTEIHTVYHIGCKWMCLADKTTQEPKWNASGWALIEGNTNLSMQFGSSNGDLFFSGRVSTTVTPVVYMGNMDISMDIAVYDWQWARDSGNVSEDNAWAISHANNGRLLELTSEDMGTNWSTKRKTAFICTVFLRDGDGNLKSGIQNRIIA